MLLSYDIAATCESLSTRDGPFLLYFTGNQRAIMVVGLQAKRQVIGHRHNSVATL